MLSKSLARIRSVPKRYGVAAVGFAVITAIICTAFVPSGGAEVPAASYHLSLPAATYNLTVALTEVEQEKGLGQRGSLPATDGMLFWYADTGQRCFWMKNMRFPIDMMWVSAAQRVVRIEHSVRPDSYPQAWCADARYIIELNAGVAQKEHITVGQKLHF